MDSPIEDDGLPNIVVARRYWFSFCLLRFREIGHLFSFFREIGEDKRPTTRGAPQQSLFIYYVGTRPRAVAKAGAGIQQSKLSEERAEGTRQEDNDVWKRLHVRPTPT